MKKLLVMLFLAAPLFSCKTTGFDLVYQGDDLTKPIDIHKLKTTIHLSQMKYNWNIISGSQGKVIAKYEKSHGKINATIQGAYSREGYSVKYIDSVFYSVINI